MLNRDSFSGALPQDYGLGWADGEAQLSLADAGEIRPRKEVSG